MTSRSGTQPKSDDRNGLAKRAPTIRRMQENRPAIILSSGGLDSTTCIAIAKEERFSPLYSLSFDYGQRHRFELEAARTIANAFGISEHRVINIDLRQFGKSALTADLAVP